MAEPYEIKPGQIALRDSTGHVRSATPEDAARLVATGEQKYATPEDVAEHRSNRARHGDMARTGATQAAAGLISGTVAPVKLATAFGASALGAEDPLAGITGQQALADIAGLGAGIAGGDAAGVSDATAEAIRRDAEANPGSALVGRTAGEVAAAILTSKGLGLGAEAFAAARGLTGRLGTAAGTALGGAIEGGIYGGAAAAEDAWVTRRELTAEQLLAGSGMGALFGGLAGGALGGALGGRSARVADELAPPPSVLSPEGLPGARRPAASVADEAIPAGAARAADDAIPPPGAAPRVADAPPPGGEAAPGPRVADAPGAKAPRLGEDLDDAVSMLEAFAGDGKVGKALDAAEQLYGRGKAVGRSLHDQGLDWMRKRTAAMSDETRHGVNAQFDEMAVSAVVQTSDVKAIRGLTQAKSGPELKAAIRDAGRRMRAMGIVDANDGGRLGRNIEEITESGGLARERVGAELGAIYERASAAAGYMPATKALTPVKGFLLDMPARTGSEVARKKAMKRFVLPFLKNRDAVSLEEMWKLRVSIDKEINYAAADTSKAGMQAEYKKLRGVIDDTINEEVDRIGATIGEPELLAMLKEAKADYKVAAWVEEAGITQMQRSATNRQFSWSDYVTAAGAAGAVGIGGVAGIPVAVVAGLMNRGVRRHFHATAVGMANKVLGTSRGVNLAAAPRAARAAAMAADNATRAVDDQALGSVSRALGGKVKRSGKRTKGGQAEKLREGGAAAYKAHRETLDEIATPGAMQERIDRQIASTVGPDGATVAPGLVLAAGQVAARAASYLRSIAPAPATDPDSITPHLDPPVPVSPAALEAYALAVEGVENPLSMLEDLEHGEAYPEKIDAVRLVWPELYERMRETTFAALAEVGKPVPYEQRIVFELALGGGGQLEPSLRPEALELMRSLSAPQEKPGGGMPRGRMTGKLSGSVASRTSKLIS